MRHEFASADSIPPDFWRWPHIHPEGEWACKGTGQLVIEDEFMDRLEKLRELWGEPLQITSGYRSPEHNQAVSSTGANGPHTTGRAADIQLTTSGDILELLVLAYGLGFTGFGIHFQKKFLHVDDLEAPAYPRPALWSY